MRATAWRRCASAGAWARLEFLKIWNEFAAAPRGAFPDDLSPYGRRISSATEQAAGDDHLACSSDVIKHQNSRNHDHRRNKTADQRRQFSYRATPAGGDFYPRGCDGPTPADRTDGGRLYAAGSGPARAPDRGKRSRPAARTSQESGGDRTVCHRYSAKIRRPRT